MNETQIREQIENLRHSEVMSEAQFHTRIHIACTLKLAQTPGPVQGGAVVRRQLFLLLDDNYFSPSTTTTL